jgi:hypothetical protein
MIQKYIVTSATFETAASEKGGLRVLMIASHANCIALGWHRKRRPEQICEAKHEIHRGRSCKMHLQPTVENLRAQDHPSSLKHSQRQDFLRQEAHKSVRISAIPVPTFDPAP